MGGMALQPCPEACVLFLAMHFPTREWLGLLNPFQGSLRSDEPQHNSVFLGIRRQRHILEQHKRSINSDRPSFSLRAEQVFVTSSPRQASDGPTAIIC